MNAEVVILSGGSGTRLWPISDSAHPKQFLKIPANQTLLEQSYERALSFVDSDHVWIVTLESQVSETRKVLYQIPENRIIAEPVGRNSAPALTTAAFMIESIRKKSVPMLVMTADHLIVNDQKFASSVHQGLTRAEEGKSLLTFGLKVTSPRTEFGYVESNKTGSKILPVKRFVEKPTLQKAKSFMKSKRFFWNSGMFAWRSDFFLSQMAKHSPAIYKPLSHLTWPVQREDLIKAYTHLPNISIDYALMEKSKGVEVIPSHFTWSDVGTWFSVHETLPQDKAKNCVVGIGKVVEGERNLIYSSNQPVYLYGVDDLVVVESPRGTLITTREKSKELKKFLTKK